MGAVPALRESPQMGQDQGGEGSQEGTKYIRIPKVQDQRTKQPKPCELPTEGMSCEQMCMMGELLHRQVTKEQQQQAIAQRPRKDLTMELSIQRQA